jgi:hypothetical protein
MRSVASLLFAGCLAGASLMATGCSGRTAEEELLSWLRTLRSESAQFGIFDGRRTQAVEARYFGVWQDVGAMVTTLDADTALSGRGAVLARGNISVENAQSTLMVATSFYDEASHPYFLASREREGGGGPGTGISCSLVTWRDGETTVVARLTPLANRFRACPDAPAWTDALGIEVYDLDHPGQQRPVSTPRGRPAS